MKQTLFVLTFLISVINGNSQDYQPIVQEVNNWSVLSAGMGAFLKICCVHTTHYKFEGDTTIQTIDYKKVLSSTDSINQKWETIGFIREDTIQKKVWLRDLENKEGLVYDFDFTLGGEIKLNNPFSGDTNTYQVTNIDSILIQTEYRKTYTLSIGGREETWTEGIGSEFGIVNSSTLSVPGGFKELLCFSDNKIQYVNSKFETCHKTSFTPFITNQYIDTAIFNQEYSYQIATTEIFYYDSISFLDSLPYQISTKRLPDGLKLNHSSGLISGTTIEVGVFPLEIYLWNHNNVTDYFAPVLVVKQPANINSNNTNISIQLFPNPSSDILNIRSHLNGSPYIIRITDLNGKHIIVKTLDKEYDKINIGNLIAGVYLISVFDKDSGLQIMTEKLIKK